MAHFAKVNSSGIVENVIVAEQDFIDTLPDANLWVQTSYNTRGGIHYYPNSDSIPSDDQSKALRKNYAGIGFTYDARLDAFIPPKNYASWLLNEETCLWEAPISKPNDSNDPNKVYVWDETQLVWVLVSQE